MDSENGKASSNDILNSADTLTLKKLKKSETEHLLNRLVHDKWLNEVKINKKSKQCLKNCLKEGFVQIYIMLAVIYCILFLFTDSETWGIHIVHQMHHGDGAIHPRSVSGPGQSVSHLSQHCFPGEGLHCFLVHISTAPLFSKYLNIMNYIQVCH